MKKKRQKLVAVKVAAAAGAADAAGAAGSESIVPIEGGTLEDLLASWRVVQIQPLGPLTAEGAEGQYLALLLLEEVAAEDTVARLGFGVS